jgi:peptide/nickel transport system permease protein
MDAPLRLSLSARLNRYWDSDIAWSYRHSPVAVAASLVALTLVLGAVLAPWLAPHNPFDAATLDLMEGFTPPGAPSPVSGRVFVLGTDSQGRDILSAILYGARVSLLVGFASVLFSVALGVTLGLVSGYLGGRTDAVIMRIADVQLSFPAILIALRRTTRTRRSWSSSSPSACRIGRNTRAPYAARPWSRRARTTCSPRA